MMSDAERLLTRRKTRRNIERVFVFLYLQFPQFNLVLAVV